MRPWIVLTDGVYDAFIVWAEASGGEVAVEATITTGAHKGEMVALRTPEDSRGRIPVDLIGLACLLVVSDGLPSLSL